jgi:hypothetical protein
MSIYRTKPMVGSVNNHHHIDLASAINFICIQSQSSLRSSNNLDEILSHISLSSNHRPPDSQIQIRPISSCQ